VTLQRLIVLGALLAALAVWVLDAVVDASYHDAGRFLDLLILNVPPRELYIRSVGVLVFIVFGLVLATVVGRRERERLRLLYRHSLLAAIRDVNQLIASADSTDLLLAEACTAFTRARICDGAWVITAGPRGRPEGLYQHGFEGQALRDLERLVRSGEAPPCFARAREQGVSVIGRVDGMCSDCPLQATCADRAAVVAPLRRGGRTLGVLGVSVGREMLNDDEQTGLIREIADDLALALHAIRVAAARDHTLAVVQDERTRVRAIADAADALIVGLDREAGIVFFNRRAQELTGRIERGVLRTDFLGNFIPEDARPAMRRAWKAVLDGDAGRELEAPLLAAEGEERLVHWRFAPLRGTDGEVVEVVAVGHDVTDLRRAQRELDQTRARFQTLVETMVDGVSIIDLQRRIAYVNDAFCRMVGRSAEELLGRPADELHPPESAALLHRQLEARFSTGPTARYETTFLRADGETFPARVAAAPLHDETGTIVGSFSVITDISELKRAQEEVERLARFPEENPYPVLRVRDDQVVEYANAPARRLLEALGTPADTVPEPWRESVRVALTTDTNQELAVECDGRTYAFVCAPVVRYHYANLYGRDITERLHAEQQLAASEARYRTIFETTSAATCMVEADGTIILANDEFAALSGWRREQLEGRLKYTDFVAPWELERMTGYHDRRRVEPGSAPTRYEFDFRTRSGEMRRILLHVDLIPGTTTSVASLTDITDRYHAEQALREREGELAAAYDYAPTIVLLLDFQGCVRRANRRAAELAGRPADALRSLPGGQALRCVHVHEHPQGCGFGPACAECVMRRTTLDTIQQGVEHDGVEATLTVETDDGQRDMICVLSTCPVQIGAETMALLHIQDVTEQRRLEEQLRQAQKMEAIGQLAGGVAHDFNNMLTVIIGNAQLLQRHLADDEKAASHLDQLSQAANRSAALTRQLLAFSRKQIFRPEVVDLADIVDDMLPMLRRTIPESIELNAYRSGEQWHTLVDPAQIEQVVINLVVNARDAMPDGGRIVIETGTVWLDENYVASHPDARPGPHVMLAISDTGEGMDAETRRRIFEPFFTTKEEGKGTGLGLATVYGIVKQSGGSIYVYSEPGRGTTFKVYLPRTFDERDLQPERVGAAEVRGGNETVLVVEDEEIVRELIVGLLRAQGYTVFETGDPEEAVRIAADHEDEIDLLIADVVMPDMSGPEVAARIHERQADIRVLHLSGYTDNAIVHHGVLDEGVNFLQKPFDGPDLARKVREILDADR